jgi:DNA invertase Pin-like site-specific DNA recombinase
MCPGAAFLALRKHNTLVLFIGRAMPGGKIMPGHRGKFVAYYRVSTDKQGESGLGLEAQRKAVETYLNGRSWTLVAEFEETESGKRSDNRPQLAAAIATCKKLKAKLVIAKLDRLSRNVAFISTLMDSGVEFVAADMPHANKLTIHILAAVAEHEREAISARTKAALAVVKERLALEGKKLGSPKLAETRALGHAANRAKAAKFAANVLPIVREIQAAGALTSRAIAQAMNDRGVRTARGGEWHDSSVRNLLARAEA